MRTALISILFLIALMVGGCTGSGPNAPPLDECFIVIDGIYTVEDTAAFDAHCHECHP